MPNPSNLSARPLEMTQTSQGLPNHAVLVAREPVTGVLVGSQQWVAERIGEVIQPAPKVSRVEDAWRDAEAAVDDAVNAVLLDACLVDDCRRAALRLMDLREAIDGTPAEKVWEECYALRGEGQKEYAHKESNAFRNFESIAKRLSVSREEVLLVYMLKHMDGIKAWVDGHRSQREEVQGRINDAIVYLGLLGCMVMAKAA